MAIHFLERAYAQPNYNTVTSLLSFPRLSFPSNGFPSPSPKSFSRCASTISAFISTINTFSFSSHSSRVWA